MSPISRPVLIGSYAALLGGFLPPWRGGIARDIDLCGRPDQLGLFGGRKPIAVAPGKWRIPRSRARSVDMDVSGASDGRLDMMTSLCRSEAMIDGVVVLLAPAEVVWATRAFTVGLNPAQHAKALRDVLWYDQLPLNLTDDHRCLAELCRLDGIRAAAAILDITQGE